MSEFQPTGETESVFKEITLTEDELEILFNLDPESEDAEATLYAFGLSFGDSVLIRVEGRHDTVYTLREDDFMTRDMGASFEYQKKHLSFIDKLRRRKNVPVEDDGTSLPENKLAEIVKDYAHSAEGTPIDPEVSDEIGEIAIEQVTEVIEAPIIPEKKKVAVEFSDDDEPVAEIEQEEVSEAVVAEEEPIEVEVANTTELDTELEQLARIYQEKIVDIKHELDRKFAETLEVLRDGDDLPEVFADLLRNVTILTEDAKMLRAFENDPDKFRKEAEQVIEGLYKAAENLDEFAAHTVYDVVRSAASLERAVQQQHSDAERVDSAYSYQLHQKQRTTEGDESHDAAAIVETTEKSAESVLYDLPSVLKPASTKAENASHELKRFASMVQEIVDESKQTPGDRINYDNLNAIVDSATKIEETYSPTSNTANKKHLSDIDGAFRKAVAAITENHQ